MFFVKKLANTLMVSAAVLASGAFLCFMFTQSGATKTQTVSQIPTLPYVRVSAELEKAFDLLLALDPVSQRWGLGRIKDALVFYGANARPDVRDARPLFLGFSGKEVVAVHDGEMFYLRPSLDGLWQLKTDEDSSFPQIRIEPKLRGDTLFVQINVQNEDGSQDNEAFDLKPQDAKKASAWDLNDLRVDASFLLRQRARWHGGDLFLAQHGGDEFLSQSSKHRILFEDGAYVCYVGVGEGLVWSEEDSRWKESELGVPSQGKPLLFLSSADDRVLHFELFDPSGRQKVKIHLVKSQRPFMGRLLLEGIRFLGAKTKQKSILEIDGKRMTVKPKDWILRKDDGSLHALTAADDIDAYVNGKIQGELFVFDEIVKNQEGIPVMRVCLYNSSRSEKEEFDLRLSVQESVFNSPKRGLPELQEESIEQIKKERMMSLPEAIRQRIEEKIQETSVQ